MSEQRPCKACGCPLMFVKTPDGKTMPLDVRAHVYKVENGVAVRIQERYVSHFFTCPKANQFSGSNRKEGGADGSKDR